MKRNLIQAILVAIIILIPFMIATSCSNIKVTTRQQQTIQTFIMSGCLNNINKIKMKGSNTMEEEVELIYEYYSTSEIDGEEDMLQYYEERMV